MLMFIIKIVVNLMFFVIIKFVIINVMHANYQYLFLDEFVGLLMMLILHEIVKYGLVINEIGLYHEVCFIFIYLEHKIYEVLNLQLTYIENDLFVKFYYFMYLLLVDYVLINNYFDFFSSFYAFIL
jgi:hypothetical protein